VSAEKVNVYAIVLSEEYLLSFSMRLLLSAGFYSFLKLSSLHRRIALYIGKSYQNIRLLKDTAKQKDFFGKNKLPAIIWKFHRKKCVFKKNLKSTIALSIISTKTSFEFICLESIEKV